MPEKFGATAEEIPGGEAKNETVLLERFTKDEERLSSLEGFRKRARWGLLLAGVVGASFMKIAEDSGMITFGGDKDKDKMEQIVTAPTEQAVFYGSKAPSVAETPPPPLPVRKKGGAVPEPEMLVLEKTKPPVEQPDAVTQAPDVKESPEASLRREYLKRQFLSAETRGNSHIGIILENLTRARDYNQHKDEMVVFRIGFVETAIDEMKAAAGGIGGGGAGPEGAGGEGLQERIEKLTSKFGLVLEVVRVGDNTSGSPSRIAEAAKNAVAALETAK